MQALILTNPEYNPLQSLAGMTLLKRNILTVRHATAEHVVVVADDAELRDQIALAHPDVTVVSAHAVTEALNDDGAVLCVSAHGVVDKGLGSYMQPLTPTASQAFAVGADNGPILVSRSVFDGLPSLSLKSLRKAAGSVEQVSVGPRFIDVDVVDERSAADATEALWQSCRKPIDGITSTYLNRYLSLFISRRLVSTSVSPNLISIICIVFGLASGVFVAQGVYWAMVVGAVLLKVGSIVDGVDGELARVRWEYSRTGELLDSSGDNLSNFSFYGALTWVMFTWGDVVYGWLGVAMLSMWGIHLTYVYGRLAKMGRGDVLIVRSSIDTVKSAFGQKVLDFFRYRILRRDSFVMLTLIFTLVGWHHATMIMMFCGAAVVFGNVVVHYVMLLVRWLSPAQAMPEKAVEKG